MFSEHTLQGKSILITGGGSGLGFAMARKFAALGANVAICGRKEEKLKNAAEELKKFGASIIYRSVDVRDYERVGQVLNRVVEEFGYLNGLVNNAAGNFLSASEELSPNGFKTVVDIVLQGTFNCTHHFGNYLIREEKDGSVLNIVTTYAGSGSAFVMPSACAKAGVLAMTRSLAVEWAVYKIRLNAIAPGPFPTEGAWTRLMPDPKLEQTYISKIPAGRFGEKRELANLAAFLMSDLAPYITGERIAGITKSGGGILSPDSGH